MQLYSTILIVALFSTTALIVETATSSTSSTSSSTSSSTTEPSITSEKSRQFLLQNSLKPEVRSLPSGLQYKILRTGNGQFHPEYDSPTVYHYEGTLIDGDNATTIDSTFRKGKPAYTQPRQTIPVVAEAMQLMVEGDVWEVYVPVELAYGKGKGMDKGNEDLVKNSDGVIFKVEMIEIKGTKIPDQFLVRCDIHHIERNCTEKEVKYVNTTRDKFQIKNTDGLVVDTDLNAIEAEIERIKKVSKKGSDKVIDWSNRRIRILNQFKNQSPNQRPERVEL